MIDLKIPFRFKLYHHNWVLKWDENNDLITKEGALGSCDFMKQEIVITKAIANKPKVLAHTVLHEIMHAVLYYSGDADLTDNESLVESMSGLLCQIVFNSENIEEGD